MNRAIAPVCSWTDGAAQSDCPAMAEHLGTWGRAHACVSHRSVCSTVGTRVEDCSSVVVAKATQIPRYSDTRRGVGTSSKFGDRP